MATSTIFNFNFNNSEIVDSTGQWYDATTGTVTTEFINHDGNTALFQPALTNGARITPNPTMLRSYDPNFSAYTYTLEVQVCAVLNRVSNSSFILNFPNDEDSGYNATALGLFYNQNDTLEMWIDHDLDGAPMIRPILIDFNTAGFDRWFSVRIERTVDPNNPYIGATVKAYVDGAEVYDQTFTYAQSTIRGKIGPRLRYCEDLYATGGIAIDNLKLTAGIAPSSAVDVSLANLQRNNANLLSFIKGKVSTVNDGTLTIQKNGSNVATFTANQSTAATANITVPTAVSELTNDSGYLTASSNLDASKLTSGTVDIARLPQGALERLVKVANEAARYALTTADVQLGDTVQQLDTGIMYVVTDTDHLDSAAGYTEYTAGTAASVPWSGVTGKPTFAAVATSGSYNDLSNRPALESLASDSIPFHNAYPRCKYLGTTITDAQNTAIKNRTYDDLFIGDYWTINGVNWRIVAIDYYYNISDTNFDKGNVIVMPDTVLYDAQMNTENTTAGAYVGSLMRTQNLNNARTIAQNAFGSHLANHRIVLANAVDASGPSGFAWYDSDGVELPNEVQIYGTRVWGSALKGYDVATQKQQFPLMLFAPQFANTMQSYWLQDVSSDSVSSRFGYVNRSGNADTGYATGSRGVRPAVTLSYI